MQPLFSRRRLFSRARSGLAQFTSAVLLTALVSCGGGGNSTAPATPATYTIGGTVSGLSGSGLVLQNNAGDDLAIAANGSFTFTTPVTSGLTYAVTVKTRPRVPQQTCTVTSGSGTASATVTGVAIACATPTPGFAYVANVGSNTVSMYTIDAGTGALAARGTVAAGAGPWSVAVDPNGQFAYVANSGSNTVSMYAINAGTGALTATAAAASPQERSPGPWPSTPAASSPMWPILGATLCRCTRSTPAPAP